VDGECCYGFGVDNNKGIGVSYLCASLITTKVSSGGDD